MSGPLLMTLGSQVVQRLYTQTSNLSWMARSAYRTNTTVPADRHADYIFRDFDMVLLGAYGIELGLRAVDRLYTAPLMTEALQLHQLEQLYPKDHPLGGYPHQNIPLVTKVEALHERLHGGLLGGKSHHLIPSLLERDFKAKRQWTPQNEGLTLHLKRLLDFPAYLQHLGRSGAINVEEQARLNDSFTATRWIQQAKVEPDSLAGLELETLQTGNRRLTETEQIVLHKLLGQSGVNDSALKTSLSEANWQGALNHLEQAEAKRAVNPASLLKPLKDSLHVLHQQRTSPGLSLAQAAEQALLAGERAQIKGLLHEGLASVAKLGQLNTIQKTTFWPPLILNTLSVFAMYGVAGNLFDVKVIQPWQKKLTAQGIPTNVVNAPHYWSLIPGGLTYLVARPALKKLGVGYIPRFAIAGGLGLAAFGASFFTLLQQKLKPFKAAAQPSLAQPVAVKPQPPAAPLAAAAQSLGRTVPLPLPARGVFAQSLQSTAPANQNRWATLGLTDLPADNRQLQQRGVGQY